MGVLNLVNSNAPAVVSVVENLGFSPICTCKVEDISQLSHLIVPGVGSFAAVADEVENIPNLTESLIAFALTGKPILGICLGMQFLGIGSDESQGKKGLGLLDYKAVSMLPSREKLPIPHAGWNQVEISKESPLFNGIPSGTDFYFSHSYKISDSIYEIGQTNYGSTFVSTAGKDNIYGVQFHPERSQAFGHKLLENFFRI